MTSGQTFGKDGADDGAYVDLDQVDGLIAAAGVAGAREIFDAFWRSTERLFAQLGTQIAAGDFAEAARSAHSLKGSAMNVGAIRFSLTARAIEDACRRSDAAAAAAALPAARSHYEKTARAFEDALKSHC